jgi:hypothetical protein
MTRDLRTVTIRVEADVWEELSNKNRSELCRDALRSNAEFGKEAGMIKRYAESHEKAHDELKRVEADLKVKKSMLVTELNKHGYDAYIDPDDIDFNNMSKMEQTIMFSSDYARTYIDDGCSDEIVISKIMSDMKNEARPLPRGIAEWIVDTIQEEM